MTLENVLGAVVYTSNLKVTRYDKGDELVYEGPMNNVTETLEELDNKILGYEVMGIEAIEENVLLLEISKS